MAGREAAAVLDSASGFRLRSIRDTLAVKRYMD